MGQLIQSHPYISCAVFFYGGLFVGLLIAGLCKTAKSDDEYCPACNGTGVNNYNPEGCTDCWGHRADRPMTTLRPYQLRITYQNQQSEDLEFTAYTLDDTVRAVVHRRREAGTPVRAIVSADGRSFEVTDDGGIHGAEFTP
jgi:hypothetical protein